MGFLLLQAVVGHAEGTCLNLKTQGSRKRVSETTPAHGNACPGCFNFAGSQLPVRQETTNKKGTRMLNRRRRSLPQRVYTGSYALVIDLFGNVNSR